MPDSRTIALIKSRHTAGESIASLAFDYGLSDRQISNIIEPQWAKRFSIGDEVMLDAAVYGGDRLKCRAIVCESFHPGASGYHLKTLEDSVYREGHRIWVSSSEVSAIDHE